jgi:MFS family permease
VHLRRARHPLLELDVLHDRIFRTSQLANSGFWLVVASVPYLMPLMMELSFHWSPIRAGTIVMFVFIGNIAIKPATTPLLNRFGYRAVLTASTVALGCVTVGIGLCTAMTSVVVISLLALISGVFRSTALTAFSTIIFATLRPEKRRAANTLSAIVMQISLGLGVALSTIAIRVGVAVTGSANSHATFLWAFVIVASVGALSVLGVMALPPDAGAELRVPARSSAVVDD